MTTSERGGQHCAPVRLKLSLNFIEQPPEFFLTIVGNHVAPKARAPEVGKSTQSEATGLAGFLIALGLAFSEKMLR